MYWFTVFLLAYFVIYVTGSYYIPWGNYLFPLIKEGLWLWFILWNMITYSHVYYEFIKKTWVELFLLIWIGIRWIALTLLLHGWSANTLLNIAVGLKYGLYSSIVFYTAASIWYTHRYSAQQLYDYIKWLISMIIYSLGLWIVWQLAKVIIPWFFYDILWYGPLWDYKVGQPHPLYYRTGPWGVMRFSGLLSGPNNLWYLLVWYASLVLRWAYHRWYKIVFALCSLMTLSRATLIGTITQLVWYVRMWYRRYGVWFVICMGLVVVWWIVVLSFVKWSSTWDHIVRKLSALIYVLQHPRGIGLWSSGPWVHLHGSILPENFYLQLIIDYWAIPFIWRCYYWYRVVSTSYRYTDHAILWWLLRWYVAWLVGLFVVWLFLHVFEDSIVNYLFFIPFGLIWGYLIKEFAK